MSHIFHGEGDEVRGRVLRFLMTRELKRAGRPLSIQELIGSIERYGFTILGRESKTVSDALRWEIAKGRVAKVRRGVYVFGFAPKSTLRRINHLAQVATNWIVAMTRPQPQTPKPQLSQPWHDYRYLWRI